MPEYIILSDFTERVKLEVDIKIVRISFAKCMLNQANGVLYQTAAIPTINAPNKLFVMLPSEYSRKLKWFKAAKRDMPKTKSIFYCCEDHFNLEQGMENYMRFKLMGGNIKLKSDIVPHIFDCQKDGKRTADALETTANIRFVTPGGQGEYEIFRDYSHIITERCHENRTAFERVRLKIYRFKYEVTAEICEYTTLTNFTTVLLHDQSSTNKRGCSHSKNTTCSYQYSQKSNFYPNEPLLGNLDHCAPLSSASAASTSGDGSISTIPSSKFCITGNNNCTMVFNIYDSNKTEFSN
ncbi:hypothetical protein NQ315_011364, partial [Exocentrus adspersus]